MNMVDASGKDALIATLSAQMPFAKGAENTDAGGPVEVALDGVMMKA